MENMVQEVNEDAVEEEEFLSDHVYEYDVVFTSDYEYMHNLISDKFTQFECDYIENNAKTVLQIKE